MNKKKLDSFQAELNYFFGKRFIVSHRSIGSMLSFDCTESGGNLTPNGIFLECCSWCLSDKRKIICSSESQPKVIEAGAQSVMNLNIQAVKFFPDTKVLAVFFDDQRVLCALPVEATGYDHWSIFVGDSVWTFGPGLILKRETTEICDSAHTQIYPIE